MVLKISRGVWLVSVLGLLAGMLTVYASLPEDVFLFQQNLSNVTVSRETFFYAVLITVTLTNALVYVVSSVFKKEEDFRSWFYGQMVTLNIFFVVAMFFLNSLNTNERFDFSRIGFLIYGSVILVAGWALSWPVIVLIRKIFTKPIV
jgi:hypothetical protein